MGERKNAKSLRCCKALRGDVKLDNLDFHQHTPAILLALAILFIIFGVVLPNMNLVTATNQLNGHIESAHVWTQSGGFLSGSQVHDTVVITLSDGTILNESFSCNYYQVGMNVSVLKTIQQSGSLFGSILFRGK